ncbi:MAG: HD domain-containing protein [Candidatus Nealsonbacteria bacterium]
MFKKKNIGILNHCAGVAHAASHISRRLNAQGLNINVDLVETASWLHDIGKPVKPGLWEHVDEGVKFLQEQGVDEKIVNLVRKHQYWGETESVKGLSWEEKIIIIADLSFSDHIIPLSERVDDIITKYSGNGILPGQEKWLKQLSQALYREVSEAIKPQTLPF